MVCLDDPAAAKGLVRAGRRMTDRARIPWVVATVVTPAIEARGPAAAGVIADALQLAERLGADTPLEVMSKPRRQRAIADDGAGQDGEGEGNVGAALVSDGEAPEFGEPGECALDDPAMLSEMGAALNALPGNAMLDAAFGASLATAGIVIPLVGMQLAGPMARPATLAMNGRNGVEQRIEHPAVMDVCAAEAHRQGNASPVGDDVALRARAPAIGGVGAGDFAPLFAAMDALSMQARVQSR